MKVKLIRWHAAVLAVTAVTVLAALFTLATVTSNAADASYDPESRTYTMSDSTYDQQIILKENTTTTINISGENKLTFNGTCIAGDGSLIITGNGTLDASCGDIICGDFTITDGAKLIVCNYTQMPGLRVKGNLAAEDAEIMSEKGYLSCGSGSSGAKHVFTDARLNLGLSLYGDAVLNDCNVTINKTSLDAYGEELTINGGTYNLNLDVSDPYVYSSMYVSYKAVVKNAVIKTHSRCSIQNLEMTDSTFESTISPIPEGAHYGQTPALYGYNLVFSGSKINIDGGGLAGLYANQKLIMVNNTEANISGTYFGIVGRDVTITHSGGKFRATDPDEAVAAITAYNMPNDPSGSVTPGTLTLKSVNMKEPAGGTIGEVQTSRLFGPVPSGSKAEITTILTGQTPAKAVVLETSHSWDAGKVTKQPTATEEGVKTHTCTVCGATKTEAIPKLSPQAPATGTDGTVFGKGASVAAAEAAILALPNDNDPAGTAFGLLQLKASKVTKKSINLKWKAVPGATKYILFANKCGTGNKYKKLAEVTGTSYTATQAAGAAIQKGTYYKFMMIAADSHGKVVSTSKTVHAATKGGKVGNHKKVTVKKSVTKKAKKLKKGKTLKLKAKAVPQARKLKVRKHRGIMYETSNPAVAQVNGKGAVKGVGKGTCYIYVYAQNGTCAKVKVTVK